MKISLTPLKAIKAHCFECSGDSYKEVRLCQVPNCDLYPYRFGKNPNRKGIGRKFGIFAEKVQLNTEFLGKGDGSEGKCCFGDDKQKMLGLEGVNSEKKG